MKIKSSNPSRNKLIYALVASIFIVGMFLTYVFMRNNNDDNSRVNYDDATQEQRDAGEQTKEEAISRDNSIKTDPDTSSGTGSPSTSSDVPIVITSTNQNSDVLQIRTQINLVTNDGTCTITLQQGSKVIEESSPVQALPNISTCKGFDIPLSKLGSGTWNITIVFKNTSGTGKTSEEVNIII